MYATRSRTAAAMKVTNPVKVTPPKTVADLPVKTQIRKTLFNMMDEEDCKLARQYKLEDREKALAEREKALAKREKELAKREKALAEREKALEKVSKKASSKSNKFNVIYTAKYRDCDPEFENIGEFADEKSAIVGVITWLIQNSQGGFDKWDLNQMLEDRCDEGYEGELDEKELIQYMSKKCKSWNDLRTVCENYGNSYFEDEDGWFLKKI